MNKSLAFVISEVIVVLISSTEFNSFVNLRNMDML